MRLVFTLQSGVRVSTPVSSWGFASSKLWRGRDTPDRSHQIEVRIGGIRKWLWWDDPENPHEQLIVPPDMSQVVAIHSVIEVSD